MPVTRPVTERLLQDGMRIARLPVAFLLVLGGCFSFLPVLGVWMLPLGLMLLAVDVPLIRPTVLPTPGNGLLKPSQVQVDKAMTVKRDRIGGVIGRLDDEAILAVTRSLALFLGLA